MTSIGITSVQSEISSALLTALETKYNSIILECKATMMIYLNNPVGIGEHPQHLEEMDNLIAKMTDASDKLELLRNEFMN
jgi:hypothetical protein